MLTPDDRPNQTHPTSSSPTSSSTPVRVLIVDDNRSYADLLASALDTIDGIECVGTATSAAEGFQRLPELTPTVVMMDLMMPGLDGLAATRQLRTTNPDTAIAVVSAHTDPEWIARAQDAGASAYIPKGGSLTELVDVLRAATPGPMIITPSLHTHWPAERPTTTPADPEPAATPRRFSLRNAAAQLKHRVQTAGHTRQPQLLHSATTSTRMSG